MYKILLLMLLTLFFIGCGSSQQINKDFSQRNYKSLIVYSTADSTNLRISKTNELTLEKANQPLETEICVFVNPKVSFQEFIGMGGAITDASAEIFASLSKEKQKELVSAYFDKDKGIGYSLIRTNINSCDFSTSSYVYVSDEDKDLKTFNINQDEKYKIPLIKKAFESTKGDLILFASPWSPPAFMKSNKSMLKGGKLLPEYYQSWATYFTKFIHSYENVGIPVWGISIQNEPMATQTWESCIYTAEEERDFLKNYLGPTMVNEKLSDKKIIVWDHNRDLMNQRANVIFGDPDAAKYAWGLGFHWYETWTGGLPMFENVGLVNKSFPDKKLLFTEGCVEKFDSTKYQFWPNAERYGRSIINDFNNGTVGWTDWNILLDQTGGPNHLNNLCFSPIHADTRTGELIYTPSYYYLGHFSKFIRPNAKKISCASSRSVLLSTAFQNPDGSNCIIVMNPTSTKMNYKLYIGNDATEITILPHSIQTILN